ncbi:MAG: hypothetical protein SFX73_01695 [Kofleriaceae bacterium]|nr:hypothetical protein [Kofleriaceae bacterium]
MWLAVVNLAACTNHRARFVDVHEPKAAVVGSLTEKAKAETEKSAASTKMALAADGESRAQREARTNELDEARAPLLIEKRQLLEYRLVLARTMATAFEAQRASCNSVRDITRHSPMRCDEIAAIATLGKTTAAEIEAALAAMERPPVAPSDAPPEASPPGGTPPSVIPVPVEVAPPGETPPNVVPAVPADLTIEGARVMVAASERELVLDRALEAQRAEVNTMPAAADIGEVEIEVSPYGNLRLARYDHRLIDGQRTRTLRGINVYRIVDVDGRTRILHDGEEEFDPEVAGFLGFAAGAPCLFGETQVYFERCLGAGTGASAGAISSRTFGTPRVPWTPRSLPHYVYDQELGSMLGLGGGLATGVQLRTAGDGRDAFSQWKLAALIGFDFDVGINLSKDSESEPRVVAAVTPELVLRAGRSEAFHLEPERIVETRRETLLDLAVGPRFDSYGRHGLSLRATLRPTVSLFGVTVRYNRYADGRGFSVIAGIELDDEAAAVTAAGVVVAAITGLVAYWIASCDDPTKDNCGAQ